MSFFSIPFILLVVLLATAISFVKNRKYQNIILLLASYIFYGWADGRLLIILMALSLSAWIIGICISRSQSILLKRIFLVGGIVISLATLVIFKYLNFFISTFAGIFSYNTPIVKLVVPLGLSFYSLQTISYIADVYIGKVQAEKEIYKVLLYIGFFPQIVSGPIVKARDFLPQLVERPPISKERVKIGIQIIILGVLKKKVVADRIAVGVNAVYRAPNLYSGLSLIVISIGYAIQIYCDFSGYSDIAIGVAYILGFDLGKNFEMPYIAKNPSDFWKRWHISLSSWFREYVYIPLGGNRKGKIMMTINLMLTMVISGLWHGADITFVIWGICHGVLSVIYAFIGKNKSDNKVINAFGILFNTLFVWILWIPFRASSISDAMIVIRRMITLADGITYISVYSVGYAFIIMMIQIVSVIKYRGKNFILPLDTSKFVNKVIICTAIFIILCFAYIGDSSFIYAEF